MMGVKTPRVALLCTVIGCAGFFAGRLGSGRGAFASPGDAELPAAQRNGSRTERAQDNARGHGTAGELNKAGIPAAAKAVLGQTVDSVRIERWIQLLSKTVPRNAAAVAELLAAEKRDGRDYPTATILFWQTWGKEDGKGALAYALEHANEGGKTGIADLMKAWAFYDPKGAADAFANLGGSPLMESALGGLSRGLAGADPAAAVDFAARLPDDLQWSSAGEISGLVIRESSMTEAQAWFDALPANPPRFQRQALRVLLENMARRSGPAAVEEFLIKRLDQTWAANPSEQRAAATQIIANGGAPWDYMNKVMEKYPDTAQPFDFVVSTASRNPKSAIEWANANPDHPLADTVLAGTARVHLLNGRLDEAKALLERVKDPALRKSAEGK